MGRAIFGLFAGFLLSFVVLGAIVSAVLGLMHLVAAFAFWGDAPPFPWLLWRFFIGFAFIGSVGFGVWNAVLLHQKEPGQ